MLTTSFCVNLESSLIKVIVRMTGDAPATFFTSWNWTSRNHAIKLHWRSWNRRNVDSCNEEAMKTHSYHNTNMQLSESVHFDASGASLQHYIHKTHVKSKKPFSKRFLGEFTQRKRTCKMNIAQEPPTFAVSKWLPLCFDHQRKCFVDSRGLLELHHGSTIVQLLLNDAGGPLKGVNDCHKDFVFYKKNLFLVTDFCCCLSINPTGCIWLANLSKVDSRTTTFKLARITIHEISPIHAKVDCKDTRSITSLCQELPN